MTPNKALLERLLSVTTWPTAYDAPGDELMMLIRDALSQAPPDTAVRQAFWGGGQGQGYFTSYSVFSYWRTGKNHYAKGRFSFIPAAFLYVSHLAPVACLGLGEGRWQKQVGRKHAAVPCRWRIGERAELTSRAPDSWNGLAQDIASKLSRMGILLLDIERINTPLPDGIAGQHAYCEGLDLPEPKLLKDVLFYEGVDWTY
jgi:hypothetical protein